MLASEIHTAHRDMAVAVKPTDEIVKEILAAPLSKLRTAAVKATEGAREIDVVATLVLARHRGTFTAGVVIVTNGCDVWASVLRDTVSKPDNTVCNELSFSRWLDRIAGVFEAGEVQTSGGSHSMPDEGGQFLNVSLEAGADGEMLALLRVATGTSGVSSQAALGQTGLRRVYLTKGVELSKLPAAASADVLRLILGLRLALTNKTARAIRRQQTESRAAAAAAVKLAEGAAGAAAVERDALTSAAVALVNSKKRALADLRQQLEEAEQQRQQYHDMAMGLRKDLAMLRLRLRQRIGKPSNAEREEEGDGREEAEQVCTDSSQPPKRARVGGSPAPPVASPVTEHPTERDEQDEDEDGDRDRDRDGAGQAATAGAAAQGGEAARESSFDDSQGGEGAATAAVHGALARVQRRRAERGRSRPAAMAVGAARRLSRVGSDDSLQ